MRIAVVGAHAVGKTTLVNALADALPGHAIVEEPYHVLTAAGHIFEDPPSSEDFEAQLELSIESMSTSATDVIFDRSPADILAYLAETSSPDVVSDCWTRAERAMASLDLVIHVPIERPDRIHVPADEHPVLRKRVDRRLRQFLEDGLSPAARTRQVSGSVSERVASVLDGLSSTKVSDRGR